MVAPSPAPRQVRLVLVRGDDPPLGVLPTFEVAVPWWPEMGPVVDGARERFGLDVTVLRLLEVDGPGVHGGGVTYLAEIDGDSTPDGVPLAPWTGRLVEHPRRMPWARAGGPAADLRWADDVLTAAGLARVAPARQVRSWNLSSLWALPLADETAAWLKAVPPFFAHEGAFLERLAGRPVPALLGHAGHRVLMAELPGSDRHDATPPELDRMIDLLIELQAESASDVPGLLALGLPDWRGPALSAAITALVERRAADTDLADLEVLRAFAADLPTRVAAVAACGLPDTLVHGDFHPGNVRGDADRLVLLDWGDCGVGHPLLDQAAFLGPTSAYASALHAHWHDRWREILPGSEPERAARLLAPVAAARQALIYQGFLDGIEPSEWPYHREDVPHWLQRTAALVRDEGGNLLRCSP